MAQNSFNIFNPLNLLCKNSNQTNEFPVTYNPTPPPAVLLDLLEAIAALASAAPLVTAPLAPPDPLVP